MSHKTSRYPIMMKLITSLYVTFMVTNSHVSALQLPSSRRSFLGSSAALVIGGSQPVAAATNSPSLTFYKTKSGLQWADAKVGKGQEPQNGAYVAVDYVLSTTGARYGSKIYGTSDKGAPYRWKLGDGSTIAGLEEAVLGGTDIPPMQAGGIRRVIIPPNLAYQSLGQSSQDCAEGIGPIPPVSDAFEEFQRFKNIYCNPNRAYQPDVVMDIKLYGKRSLN